MMDIFFPGLILLQMLCFVSGYSTGAPTGACEDMLPLHMGVQAQPPPAPYTVLTNTRTYEPGVPITVTITGAEYRGLLLEARTGSSTNALGRWQLPPPGTRFLQCTGNPQGAVTQYNSNLKGNTTVYNWIPPDSTSPIYFKATVVQQRTVFWVDVKSDTLTRGKPGVLGPATSAGRAKEKPLLLLLICFLQFQVLG